MRLGRPEVRWEGDKNVVILFRGCTNSIFNYLPCGILPEAEVVECVRVVELPEVSKVEKRQQKAQTFPHPRVEPVDGDVHVIRALAEGFQSEEEYILNIIICITKGNLSKNGCTNFTPEPEGFRR